MEKKLILKKKDPTPYTADPPVGYWKGYRDGPVNHYGSLQSCLISSAPKKTIHCLFGGLRAPASLTGAFYPPFANFYDPSFFVKPVPPDAL